MLKRPVMINGNIYDTHRIASVVFLPPTEIVVTVASSVEPLVEEEEDSLEEIGEHYYSIPWNNQLTSSCTTLDDIMQVIEDLIWALPAFQEYRNFESDLNAVLGMLTDEQAQEVTALYPEWHIGTLYRANDRVRYNDILYKCLQDNLAQTGWEPSNVPALWVKVAPEGTIPDWEQPAGSHDAYNKGDKVIHNGKTWVSSVDSNVWEPGVYGWDIVN